MTEVSASTTRASQLAALLIVGLSASAVRAAPVVEDDMVAFLEFEEGSGDLASDTSGNGHDAELVDSSWGTGYASVDQDGAMLRVSAGPEMQGDAFTYDLWFEAGSTSGKGRILGQASAVGGEGPDVLERYGRWVGIRINNQGAVFAEPSIGSRSNDGPPDHWGTCDTQFHRDDGPEHLVITHDGDAKMVRIFIGLDGDPLRLCFEAEYSGSYDVDSGPLALGNLPAGDRYFRSKFYQFTYYDRPLTFSTDSGNVVNGGEVLVNHLAGPQPDLPAALIPDAGVPDAGALDAAPPDTDDPDAGVTPPTADASQTGPSGDGSVHQAETGALYGGCSATSTPTHTPWLLLLALAAVRRRRRRREPTDQRNGSSDESQHRSGNRAHLVAARPRRLRRRALDQWRSGR